MFLKHLVPLSSLYLKRETQFIFSHDEFKLRYIVLYLFQIVNMEQFVNLSILLAITTETDTILIVIIQCTCVYAYLYSCLWIISCDHAWLFNFLAVHNNCHD